MSESGASEREPDPTSERLAHQQIGSTEPDVLLDVPEVSVDSIRLAVDGLDADLSLRARLANLLQLDAGVRVHLEGVELDITGVHAEALLKVRLEKLLTILDRALTTIDRNPQIIEALARTAETSIDDVNRSAQQLAGAASPLLGQVGQQVGAVGAVADRSLRERAAEPRPACRRHRPAPGRRSHRAGRPPAARAGRVAVRPGCRPVVAVEDSSRRRVRPRVGRRPGSRVPGPGSRRRVTVGRKPGNGRRTPRASA
ncbi:hypothetical protein [Micromonospora sp. ATA51]|uniref:hypothetical protein n=1 Tax=Micromonospora sp. ATA51 TaxID=2806098 RepID=UPI001A55C815|nr:hypothetical protein [Micromonospora sp. ATA51]MBM0225641.1 hypothetical protein [Micromonospora sp. ATA51]